MKLTRFLADAHMKGGAPIPDDLDPLPLIHHAYWLEPVHAGVSGAPAGLPRRC
jgi:hypothetical protein